MLRHRNTQEIHVKIEQIKLAIFLGAAHAELNERFLTASPGGRSVGPFIQKKRARVCDPHVVEFGISWRTAFAKIDATLKCLFLAHPTATFQERPMTRDRHMTLPVIRRSWLSVLAVFGILSGTPAIAETINGEVLGGGAQKKPVANEESDVPQHVGSHTV